MTTLQIGNKITELNFITRKRFAQPQVNVKSAQLRMVSKKKRLMEFSIKLAGWVLDDLGFN